MLDELDRGVVHALHIDGRAPFSRIADVLGVSTQTVARRYRRLRAEAGLRVVGLLDRGLGGTQWMVRLTCTPSAAQSLAHAIARRPDTSWVKLASGGTEIFAIVHVPDASHSMLLHDIPRRAGITAVSAHCLLHTYRGGPTTWWGKTQALDERQQELLRPPGRALHTVPGGQAGGAPDMDAPPLDPVERAMLDVLGQDGRASHAELAAATGWSPATVARRLADLRERGAIFFDLEIDSRLLGATTQTLLWMTVAPARLDAVARAITDHHELAVVAATTGPTNLMAQALCSGPADLHRYLTRRLAVIEGIQTLETAPVLRTLKQAATVEPVRTSPDWRSGRKDA